MNSHNLFNPLVSIIIPVYNGSDYLAEAIESAIKQTYTKREILVVNDGSNDGGATRSIALSFGDTVRYFEKPNGGVASAFNFGIKQMCGDYFSWLSHDDVYLETKIETQVDTLNKLEDKDTILFSEYLIIDESSKTIGKSNINFSEYKYLDIYIALKRPLINGNTILASKKAFDEVGFFNERLKSTQDYDMWFKFAKMFPFLFINKALIKSRVHTKQGSKINVGFRKESLDLKIEQLSLISEKNLKIFTKSKTLSLTYFKLFFFSYYHGGDSSEYPMSFFASKFFTKCSNNLTKHLMKIVFSFFFLSLTLPNKIRRILVKILFVFSNSPLKIMLFDGN